MNPVKPSANSFEPFPFRTAEALRAAARRLKLDLPLSPETAALAEPLAIGARRVPNRFCVQPMEGCDAGPDGAPGVWTRRRYRRWAEGGFGMIWMEAAAVGDRARSHPRQLRITRRNVRAFAAAVAEMRQCARERWGHEIVILLQLAHAGRYCRPGGTPAPVFVRQDPVPGRLSDEEAAARGMTLADEELDRLQDATVEAGLLAVEAGFDGVDLKACHGDLHAELLGAIRRPGRYGGSLENRTRFLREVAGRLRAASPGMIVASRLSPAEDGAEDPERVRMLAASGVGLFNVAGSAGGRGRLHPLRRFARLAEVTQAIQRAVPEIPVVAEGFSFFRRFLPQVAAGVLQRGGGSLIGIGRAALADPGLAGAVLRGGEPDPESCCIGCDACVRLIRDGGRSGCVVTDRAVYGEEYALCRHGSLERLREEARRCRGCEPAPCRAGCPTRIDVPAFLRAFAAGDDAAAYAIIRRDNVLPGMCASLCPVCDLCEGRCVAGTLDGVPIPIHAIQHAVWRHAQESGLTGLRLPEKPSGRKAAVIGAGPAGVACAVTLLERGHQVVLFERTTRLGGTPELVIRDSRFTGAHEEAQAVLMPALRAARLTIRFGSEFGREVTPDSLRQEFDAVFLGPGVWGERSVGTAPGVVAGLTFLRRVKTQAIRSVPERVILLAGGDSAMDCARVALEAGARELLIVYDGPLSGMHWHMADAWFRTAGVHFLTLTRPVGYRIGADGNVTGLKIRKVLEAGPEGGPAPETILEAGLVIEAMGLGLEEPLVSALRGCAFGAEGLVKTGEGSLRVGGLPGFFAGGGVINGGASVAQCVAEGMRAGSEMDASLRGGEREGRGESCGNPRV